MVSMKEAVSHARSFLTEQAGIPDPLLYLEELHLESGKWNIKFKCAYLMGKPDYYLVKVDDEKGEVVGFSKISP